jgi:hypothetical protein
MRIEIKRFTGMRPVEEPHLLQLGEAQKAENCLLERGSIEPLYAPTIVRTTSISGPRTIWRYPGATELLSWFEFSGRANIARSPIQDDIWDRIYWTDSVGAKYGPSAVVIGANSPAASYTLGVPAPSAAPTITAYEPGVTDYTESRAYLETFCTQYDEEGPPSPISAVVDVDPREDVSLGSLNPVPSIPGKNFNITHRYIYRTSYTGGLSSGFQRVVKLPIATTSFVDNVPQSNLGANLSSEGYDMPPDGAHGLIVTESGVTVLLRGNDVFLSEVGLPHAYDYENVKRLQYKAVAAAAFEQFLVVMTEGDLYVGGGNTPAGIQLMRLADSQPCLSDAGVVVTRGGVYYPSPIGYIAVGTDLRPVNVTEKLMTQKQWLSYNPKSFVAAMRNGKLRVYFERADLTCGVIVFDPTGKTAPMVTETTPSSLKVTAAWRDPSNDNHYFTIGSNLYKEVDSGSVRTWVWRSGEFRFPQPLMLSAFVIMGEPGTVTFRSYRNGILHSTKSIATNVVGRLPTGRRGLNWSFEIQASIKVTELRVAPSVKELWE